jgi:class 3 adenylate cyclase/tetratricopeptide (TPR) repeat protein
MIACPGCGFEASDEFAFCPKCATKLATPPSIAEERKTVTTLFCDLVDFTAMSEAADPEDVDALLGRYHDAARDLIESHGGTVEKFIGDAVVGVFGVPAVHEDDPERAVRAGLRLIEALEGLARPDGSSLEARVGIDTGEALVRLDVDPASGRGFLTGDAVNTAARLQAAAPPDGVIVGVLTHELTARVVDYEELPPVAAKGKAEPVAAWRAVGALARRGIDVPASELTSLVGREMELTYLSALFEKSVAQSTPQFALVVGEPGIGKSRLVLELYALVDARPQMTTWRQGYCLPYGEDATYSALAQIIKGHASILDSDELGTVETKLAAVLPSGPDREWFRQRLRPLLGLEAPEASREENFTAWLRFFEDAAAKEPTVLVFEDLHWADDPLLAFLAHLATHLASVPVMLVGTARPELFERQPGFAASGAVSRVNVGPLSVAETTRLVGGLLGESDERARTVGAVVERCEGNPFFAEQSVRLLAESVIGKVPSSVQAVIAARLDSLTIEEKGLLGDAAVVGNVFWDGATRAVGERQPGELEDLLSALLERQLIRRLRESSLTGEREFAFVHALAREVAYGQLPRAARARKHVTAARWLLGRLATRAGEQADLLAYHFTTAFDLACSLRDDNLVAAVRESAIIWLGAAEDRAQPVDLAAARRHYVRALEIAAADDGRRATLLLSLGETLLGLDDGAAAVDVLQEAAALALQRADTGCAVQSHLRLYQALWTLGRRPANVEALEQALALARSGPPSRDLVDALATWCRHKLNGVGDADAALAAIDEAVAVCEQLSIEPTAHLLSRRGQTRCSLGDASGLDDLCRAREIALGGSERTSGWGLGDCLVAHAIGVDWVKGPRVSISTMREAIDVCQRRGITGSARAMRAISVETRLFGGDWASLPADVKELDAAFCGVDSLDALADKAVWSLLSTWCGRSEDVEEALAALERVIY